MGKPGSSHAEAAAQLSGLRNGAAPDDTVFTLTSMEPLDELILHPLHWLNRGNAIHLYWLIDGIRADAPWWRSRFARLAEASWAEGRGVWVERAAVGDAPTESSLWVEGDNPKVHWADLPAFFRGLEFDGDTGGPTGFLRVAAAMPNRLRLQQVIRDEAVGTESGLRAGISSKDFGRRSD